MNPFSLNFEAIDRAGVIEIGEEKQHRLLVIDDFFANPDALRQSALNPARRWITQTSGYPGLRAYPEPEYLGELASFVEKVIGRKLRNETDQIAFSMVTKTEDQLAPAQRRPHFDGPCTGGLVYLNPPEQCRGGTGFYRHRATGLSRYPETITAALGKLIQKLGLTSLAELQKLVNAPPRPDASGYITDTNSEWERISHIEMKFNRLLMYDGQIFHSAVVNSKEFGTTPRERRLTLNFFADRI